MDGIHRGDELQAAVPAPLLCDRHRTCTTLSMPFSKSSLVQCCAVFMPVAYDRSSSSSKMPNMTSPCAEAPLACLPATCFAPCHAGGRQAASVAASAGAAAASTGPTGEPPNDIAAISALNCSNADRCSAWWFVLQALTGTAGQRRLAPCKKKGSAVHNERFSALLCG